MTGNTREYLADLANRKGVSLPAGQDGTQKWASDKIEELKQLPDANFNDFTEEDAKKVQSKIDKILEGMGQWTFQE